MNSTEIDNIVNKLVTAMRTQSDAQIARKIIDLTLPLSREEREVVLRRISRNEQKIMLPQQRFHDRNRAAIDRADLAELETRIEKLEADNKVLREKIRKAVDWADGNFDTLFDGQETLATACEALVKRRRLFR